MLCLTADLNSQIGTFHVRLIIGQRQFVKHRNPCRRLLSHCCTLFSFLFVSPARLLSEFDSQKSFNSFLFSPKENVQSSR